MISFDWIVEHLWAPVIGGLAWLMRIVWTRIDKVQDQIHAVEKELPEKYVNVTRFENLADDLRSTLYRIEDKLDRKVDK